MLAGIRRLLLPLALVPALAISSAAEPRFSSDEIEELFLQGRHGIDVAATAAIPGPGERAARSRGGGVDPDDGWGDEFGEGVVGTVFAITGFDGAVVLGGDLTRAGNLPVEGIVRWQDGTWQDLGEGANGTVTSLVEHDGDLYAGGTFTTMDGVDAAYVARYDGSSWTSLGTGLDGAVYAMASHDGSLYVTGTFVRAGGVDAPYVACWDGSVWSDVGGGLDFTGWDLEVVGGALHVVGAFGSAGGNPAIGVARLDGATWTALGSGPGLVLPTCAGQVQGDLVVAGWGGVLRWTGTDWVSLDGLDDWVYALTEFDGKLIAGGYFQNGPDGPIQRIAAWDGTSWAPLGRGADRLVRALAEVDGALYVGGSFTRLQGPVTFDYVVASGVARYDGTVWSPVGQGGEPFSYDAVAYGGGVVVGGEFTRWGGVDASNIVAHDGTAWSALGAGTNGPVLHVVEHDGDLIAAGSFTTAGGAPAARVARWDGASWHPMGDGLTGGSVAELRVHDGLLYATGYFTASGATTVRYIGVWDGTSWSEVGGGFNTGGASLTSFEGDLVAAGNFTMAGGVPATRVARWDGASWHAMGDGLDSFVYEVEAYDGMVIAGGRFDHAGDVRAACLAAWDGTSWSSIAPPVTGTDRLETHVHGMTVLDGYLYVGGDFSRIGSIVANHVARWDGTTWSGLGSGLTYTSEERWSWIWDMSAIGSSVYVTGGFDRAGGRSSQSIARWQDPGVLSSPDVVPSPSRLRVGAPAPNPFAVGTFVELVLDEAGAVTAEVFDVRGRRVRDLGTLDLAAGPHRISWDGTAGGRPAGSGVYYIRFAALGQVRTVPVVRGLD